MRKWQEDGLVLAPSDLVAGHVNTYDVTPMVPLPSASGALLAAKDKSLCSAENLSISLKARSVLRNV